MPLANRIRRSVAPFQAAPGIEVVDIIDMDGFMSGSPSTYRTFNLSRAVDLSRAFPIWVNVGSSRGESQELVRVDFEDANTIRARRGDTAGSIRGYVLVCEGDVGTTVQEVTGSTSSGTFSYDHTITAVDTSRTLALITNSSSEEGGPKPNRLMRAEIQNATTVRARISGTNGNEAYTIFVVELPSQFAVVDNWDYHSISGTSDTFTLSRPINLHRSFLLTRNAGNDGRASMDLVQAQFTDNQTIQVRRSSDISFIGGQVLVVEAPPGSKVQTLEGSSGDASFTVAIDAVADMDRTMLVVSNRASTATDADLIQLRPSFDNASTVRLEREDGSGTVEYTLFVVEYR